MKLGSAIPRSRQQSSKTIITNLTPHLDSNLRKRALKHLKLSSQMPSALPQSTICEVYIVKKVFFDIASPVSPTTVSASSRPSSSTAISHTAVAKVDAVWVLIQNDEGCIVGSRLVSVKAMEEREIRDKVKASEEEVRRREMGWETVIPGGDRKGLIVPTKNAQKKAALELERREVERQAG